MLIVGGTITVEPADIDRLRPAVAQMVAATLEEPGCHQYAFAESLTEAGTIQIFEIWQSPEDLDAHFATPHMAEFRSTLETIAVTGRELYRYEVSNQTRL